MNEIILGILGIIAFIISLALLYSMPSAFLKEFEKSCLESIKKRDKELEEKEKINKELRKWLLK